MDENKTQAEKHLSPEHIRCIGLLSAEWGYVDSAFETLLWNLAGIRHIKAGIAVTTHLVTITRIDITRTLANALLKDEKQRDSVLDVIKEFDRLRIERNHIVHAHWYSVEELENFPLTLTASARGQLIFNLKGYDVSTILKIVSDMTALHARLTEISQTIPYPKPEPLEANLTLLRQQSDIHGPSQK